MTSKFITDCYFFHKTFLLPIDVCPFYPFFGDLFATEDVSIEEKFLLVDLIKAYGEFMLESNS